MKLINTDCLADDGIPSLEENSIDMILCDLPYGVTKNKWDTVIPFEPMWEQYWRVLKPKGAIVLFACQPFTTSLIYSCKKYFRYTLVWQKNKFSDFLNARRKPMKIHEDICLFYKKQPTYNPQYTYSTPYKRWNTQKAVNKQSNYGKHKENVAESKDGRRLPITVLKFNRIERPAHPTQKPVDLCEWLIKSYSNEGDTILDNTMGVGTTGIACLNTKRNFVGIELDEKYYNQAVERINKRQGELEKEVPEKVPEEVPEEVPEKVPEKHYSEMGYREKYRFYKKLCQQKNIKPTYPIKKELLNENLKKMTISSSS